MFVPASWCFWNGFLFNFLMYYFSILQLVKDLLKSLPALFSQSRETHSALGPALQAAFKLMSPTGGRITVFQTQLPTLGAGKLQSREDPNQRSSSKVIIFSFICDYNEKKQLSRESGSKSRCRILSYLPYLELNSILFLISVFIWMLTVKSLDTVSCRMFNEQIVLV